VYVATVDLPFTLAKMSYPLGGPDGNGTGEIEALNLTTGKVEWDTKVPAMPPTSNSRGRGRGQATARPSRA
jgi:hypothetical protein